MSFDIPEFQKNASMIFMLPQVHSVDWNFDAKVIESQRYILESLFQLWKESGVEDFFVEWVVENVDWQQLYDLAQSQQVRNIFSDKNKKQMQDKILAQLWAYRVFCILYKWNFKIHPTSTNYQLKTIENKINNLWIAWACEDLTGQLEYFAEWEIKNFQKQNPWKNIALIFWQWHDFSDNFSDKWEKYYLVQFRKDLDYLFKQVKNCIQ